MIAPVSRGIAIVDYQAGNLASVRKALAAAGAESQVTSDPAVIERARGIVIPGVGHFAATSAISGPVRAALLSAARAGTPVLGICLGLQFLFDGSEEAPDAAGLGLLRGRCTLIPPGLKVPHVGWNGLAVVRPSRILAGIPDRAHVYFTHSYAAPVTDACVATATHNLTFAAAVERANVFGVQFHPEKSADVGLRIVRSFVERT